MTSDAMPLRNSIRDAECQVTLINLTRLLAIGQLVLIAVTWKLWTPQDVFPQVPLIRVACDWPGWIDWACLVVLVIASLMLLIRPRQRRIACAAMAGSLATFFTLDQHRLQPWAWQFFLLAILLALADDTIAMRGWMWLTISIYFWSAVSKLDYTFCHEQGPALLGGLKSAMGLRGIPNRWTEMIDVAGSLGVAAGELAVAVLLAWPRTRWFGVWAATIMHVALLAALGPLGLKHSAGVLMWNVFFIVQDWLLFVSTRLAPPPSFAKRTRSWSTRFRNWINWPASLGNRMAIVAIIGAAAWPVLEPVGYCDHWLAWAVYSARPGTVDLFSDLELQNLPIRQEMVVIDIKGSPGAIPHHPLVCYRLDIAQWSLQELGVPAYPQHRFHVGVVRFLAHRYGFRGELILWNPRSRWNGISASNNIGRIDESGADGLTRLSNSFLWNTRPREK